MFRKSAIRILPVACNWMVRYELFVRGHTC